MNKTAALAIVVSAFALIGAVRSAKAADPALINAAKKEGRVVWYTTQQINPLVRPVADAFQKKYGIAVDYVRADSSDVALRIFNEGKAGHMQSDVFDGTAAVAALKKANMVVKWLPDSVSRLPKEYVDSEGYWVACNLYVNTPAFNTTLIAPGTEPKTLNDLLAPKLKGTMVWSTANSASAGPGFVGLVLTEMGQDKGMNFLHALAKQNIAGTAASAREILNQVVAGEYALGLQMFNHAAVLSAQQGAPVQWIPMVPALLTLNVVGLTASGPHPNAAKLLEDFIVSSEGQELYKKAAVLTVDPDVAPFDPSLRPDGANFRAIALSPESLDEKLPGWDTTFNEIFH